MVDLKELLIDLKEYYYKYFAKPCSEVLEANYNKLPNEIEVDWFRDGKYIIGKIKAENSEYMTQAISAEEFIEMVNDTIVAAYEVPSDCLHIMRKVKKFVPTREQFKALNNAAIKKSSMSIVKKKELIAA